MCFHGVENHLKYLSPDWRRGPDEFQKGAFFFAEKNVGDAAQVEEKAERAGDGDRMGQNFVIVDVSLDHKILYF